MVVCTKCGSKIFFTESKPIPHYRVITNVSYMSVAALESGAAEEIVLCDGDVAELADAPHMHDGVMN